MVKRNLFAFRSRSVFVYQVYQSNFQIARFQPGTFRWSSQVEFPELVFFFVFKFGTFSIFQPFKHLVNQMSTADFQIFRKLFAVRLKYRQTVWSSGCSSSYKASGWLCHLIDPPSFLKKLPLLLKALLRCSDIAGQTVLNVIQNDLELEIVTWLVF